jgi:plastocyanin
VLNDDSFGFRDGHFGFNITGSPNQSVAVEVSTNLLPGTWAPIWTQRLNREPTYFSNPHSLPKQFYRVRKFEDLRIVSQPQSQQVDPGATVTFTVTARGEEPLLYQWQFDGAPIPGATNASYTIEAAQPEHAGSYHAVISHEFGTANSEPALLTVLVRPTIVAQPQDQTVRVGETVTFTVSVTNHAVLPVGYRWRRDFATVDNQVLYAHTSSLTITNVQPSDAGSYTVVVTNAAFYQPGYLSSPAVLNVLEQ